MLDVSHLNERGFWDLAAINRAPMVATYSCAHVVGFNFSVCDARPDAILDPNISIDVVVRHLSHLVERMGENHVAFGSDFDGAVMPAPIKDASHLPNLIQALRANGFDDATLRKIAFENWMRVFRKTWR